MASPGQSAGRGLKPCYCAKLLLGTEASPGQSAGRGLKLRLPRPGAGRLRCIARPIGRARIETVDLRGARLEYGGIARPIGRARIETAVAAAIRARP